MEYQPFSVAISVYGNDIPSYFDRALESITDCQTVKPNEIVLVVDGPVPDGINAVIDKYSKVCNLKTIRLETNGGLGNALRIATENCSSELIARMDSDDIAIPNRFEKQLDFLNNNENIDIVGGNITEFVGSETNVVSQRIVPSSDTSIKSYLKKRCPFNHMTVMFKKSAVLAAGGYIDFHYNEDYYLWVRMFLNGSSFANLSDVLVNVRTGGDLYVRRGGYKYFKSEKSLQKYMFAHKIIGFWRYFINCVTRFIVQVVIPNRLRGFFYRTFARKVTKKQS